MPALIEGLPAEVVIADKGYDSRAVAEAIEAKGAEVVIPSLKNRAKPRAYDQERDKDRNLAERFWSKAKQYRWGGDPVREDGPELPGVRSCGLDHDPTEIARATPPTQLLSTRPRRRAAVRLRFQGNLDDQLAAIESVCNRFRDKRP